jgi:hypothetical protein
VLAVLALEGRGSWCRFNRIWQEASIYDSEAEKASPVIVVASFGYQVVGTGGHSGCLPIGGSLKPLFTELCVTFIR